MKRPFLVLSLILPIAVSFSQTLEDGRATFGKSDKRLNDAYQMLLAVRRSDTVFTRNLKASQRAWIQFRNAEMTLNYPNHASIEKRDSLPMDQALCLVHLTEDRTKALLGWLKTATNGLVSYQKLDDKPLDGNYGKDISKQSLVSYYPFNGNADDQSGNGHNGILHGATLTADRFGNPNSAYRFNGIDDYMSATLNELKNADSWTISLWVNADEFNGGGPFALLTSTPGYRADGFWWHFLPDGTVRYRIHDNSAGLQLMNDVSVPIHSHLWQHHVITIRKNQVVHYVDGKKIFTWNTAFSASRLDSNDLELRIGEGYNFEFCYPLTGSIDDIYVFNRELSETDIQRLYADTK